MMKISILFAFLFGFTVALQAQEYGLASYYSEKFQGRPTASGENYDKDKLTAAHKTLPFGTYIRVTRLDNKKSVVVRVNDRGPYIAGRVVDISKKAADLLDLTAEGTARVKVDVVQAPTTDKEELSQPVVEAKPATVVERPTERPVERPAEPAKETPAPAKVEEKPKATAPATVSVSPPTSVGTSIGEPVLATGKNFQSYDLYKIDLFKPEKAGYAVQVASLTSHDNALRQVAELQGKFFKNVLLSIEKAPNGASAYKILLGPFPTKEAAEAYRKNLKKQNKMDGFIVDLSTIVY